MEPESDSVMSQSQRGRDGVIQTKGTAPVRPEKKEQPGAVEREDEKPSMSKKTRDCLHGDINLTNRILINIENLNRWPLVEECTMCC